MGSRARRLERERETDRSEGFALYSVRPVYWGNVVILLAKPVGTKEIGSDSSKHSRDRILSVAQAL